VIALERNRSAPARIPFFLRLPSRPMPSQASFVAVQQFSVIAAPRSSLRHDRAEPVKCFGGFEIGNKLDFVVDSVL